MVAFFWVDATLLVEAGFAAGAADAVLTADIVLEEVLRVLMKGGERAEAGGGKCEGRGNG